MYLTQKLPFQIHWQTHARDISFQRFKLVGVRNALAWIKKATILTGSDTWGSWEQGVLFLCHDLQPTSKSSVGDIKEYVCYNANNSAVLQILLLRVSDDVWLSLLGADDMGGCCLARKWYLAAKEQYGPRNDTKIIMVCTALFAMTAQSIAQVSTYVDKYHMKALAILHPTKDVNWNDMIHHFGIGLPHHNELAVVLDDIIHKLTNRKPMKATSEQVIVMVTNHIMT
ncbi:hypothetical protein PQX77_017777 [Marasmius sp. AFHP31]|nr:hypothetical protein PQX77_017777 [Marasmius sp. AFHP31]